MPDPNQTGAAEAIREAVRKGSEAKAGPLKAYRQCVFDDANKLRLEAIHSAGAARKRDLASIYVALDTQTPKPRTASQSAHAIGTHDLGRREDQEYVSALEAVIKNRRVVLHGAPGSGKSTFVQFLSLCLAGEALAPGQGWAERLRGWPKEDELLIPFTIELRRFAKDSPRPLSGEALPAHLWDYLARELKDRHGDHLVALARSALEQGRGIILLDGLDEIAEPPPAEGEDPAAGRRKQFVRDAILAFARPPFADCRFLLTCRTRSYVDQPWALDWPAFGLRDFDRDKIIQFAEFWFSGPGSRGSVALTQSEIAGQKSQLIHAIDDRPHLLEVAGIPLLLTLMAFVHQHEGELPRSQAKLYERIIELLLFHWHDEGTSGGATALGLRPLLGRVSENALLETLRRVAWEVQQADQAKGLRKEPADISGERLRNALADLRKPRNLDWANQVIAALQLRAGLLRYVSGTAESPVFAFLHRSFQEYFAGADLALRRDFPQESIRLLQADLPYWQNTVRWASGRLAHRDGRFGEVRDLVRELCLPFESAPSPANAPLVLLAGEILSDAGPPDIARTTEGPRCILAAQEHLQALMLEATRNARSRGEAGTVLGKIGDPRPGVGVDDDGLPDFVWCGATGDQPSGVPPDLRRAFPGGPFPMGGDPEAYGSANAPFTCTRVRRPFFLSKYPVTVAQYRGFWEQQGYGPPDKHAPKPPWWTEAGWAWRNGEADLTSCPDWYTDWYRKQSFPILRPEDFGGAFETPNHPRVGVSWHEAVAFCRWLTLRLREANASRWPKDAVVRLPTDPEWELAARWAAGKGDGSPDPLGGVDGRVFPWGNPLRGEKIEDHLSARCNWGGTGLSQTSAVGLFPDGKAACGAMDLAGNVWEWCQSKWVALDNESAQQAFNSSRGEATNPDVDEGTEIEYRVLRGGSWVFGNPVSLRAAGRDVVRPGYRNFNYGFRVVVVGG